MSDWDLDAQFVTELNEKYLFKNAKVSTYLRKGSYTKFILVASKGMGKTLLLKYKRDQIERSEKSILLIPKNAVADYVNLPASPSNEFRKLMSERVFWVDIWKLSIAISCLLNFRIRANEDEINYAYTEIESASLPAAIVTDLKNAFAGKFRGEREPSSIVDILLQSKSDIEKTRSTAMNRVMDLFVKHVSSACFVFIDSFDQALTHNFPDDLTVWCSAQTGLMKAAWELSRQNKHVKVFVTIRQEAFASFDEPERLNIAGSAIVLEYSKSDLEGIFKTAIRHYEKCDSTIEFFGFTKIHNSFFSKYEDTFSYLCRHTIYVPRWLMKLGEEISSLRTERTIIQNASEKKAHQDAVVSVINRVSSEDLAKEHICSEMKMFFKGTDPKIFLRQLLGLIYSNVITYRSLIRISEKFLEEGNWCGTSYPFCLLYNLGFVGYVGNDVLSSGQKQIFRKPYQFDWGFEDVLPKNTKGYYLIHPALNQLMQSANYRVKFNPVMVGDGLNWGEKEEEKIDAKTLKIFISYSHEDSKLVERITDVIERYLNEQSILNYIWLDRWKMRGGQLVQDQMFAGLKSTDYLILIASKSSISSSAVNMEWKTKFSSKIFQNKDTVFPLVVDETDFCDLPDYLPQVHSYRYTSIDDERNIIRLVKDIISIRRQCNTSNKSVRTSEKV